MNEIMKTRRYVFPLLLALTACAQEAPVGPPPLEGARMGGAFTLTDGDGRTVRDSDFAGKYRLVYFGYTFCPDVCPTDVDKLMRGYAALEKSDPAKGSKIQPIFITIDPERDGPKEVKAFTAAFSPKLIGLTGSVKDIKDVAKRYGISFSKVESKGMSGYLMEHTAYAILYGPKGEPIAKIPHDAVSTPEQVAASIGRWIK